MSLLPSFLAAASDNPRLHAEIRMREGMRYHARTHYAAAAEMFLKALEEDPTCYRARRLLGNTFYRMGRVEDALDIWREAVTLGDTDPFLRHWINRVLALRGEADVVLTNYLPHGEIDLQAFRRHSLRGPTGIAVDEEDRVYVVGFVSGNLLRITASGEVDLSLSRGGGRRFRSPYDVALGRDGDIFVSDFGNDRVCRFDHRGRFRNVIGATGVNPGELSGPQGIAVGPDGTVAVVDSGNERVQRFHPDGALAACFGGPGSRAGEFSWVTDVAFGPGGEIYVADRGNGRVQVFDVAGNWLRSFGEGYLERPRGIAAWGAEYLLIGDDGRGLLRYHPATRGWLPMAAPFGPIGPPSMGVNDRGMLYAADYRAGLVRRYLAEDAKTVNLFVDIVRSDVAAFPGVIHVVHVRDARGEPVEGLSSRNFTVEEEGVRMFPISAKTPAESRRARRFAVVLEKSEAAGAHAGDVARFLESFVRYLPTRDRVLTRSSAGAMPILQGFTNAALSVAATARGGYSGATVDPVRAIRRAIEDDLLWSWERRAVLYVGGAAPLSENATGVRRLIEYARSSAIPVSTVGLGERRGVLARIAEGTGGRYFDLHGGLRPRDITRWLDATKTGEYYVSYRTVDSPAFEGMWRPVRMRVEVRGLLGVGGFGYYVPED